MALDDGFVLAPRLRADCFLNSRVLLGFGKISAGGFFNTLGLIANFPDVSTVDVGCAELTFFIRADRRGVEWDLRTGPKESSGSKKEYNK